MRQGRNVAVVAASAALLLAGLTACTGGSGDEKQDSSSESPAAEATKSGNAGKATPIDDGEYEPTEFDELDSDAGIAARQFAMMFYDWDSRDWGTENPTGEQMAGKAAMSVMTKEFATSFDSDGLVPYGIPQDFNAPQYHSAGSYVETMDLTTAADEHTATETFQLWDVDIRLNIVEDTDDDEPDERDEITRSETMTLPAVLTLVREKKGEPWEVDDVNVERAW